MNTIIQAKPLTEPSYVVNAEGWLLLSYYGCVPSTSARSIRAHPRGPQSITEETDKPLVQCQKDMELPGERKVGHLLWRLKVIPGGRTERG